MPTSRPQRDYYEVLGVSRDAHLKEVERAFRQFAMWYHPDHCKEPDATEKSKEVSSKACAVLSDPDKRRQYDAYGFAGVSGCSHAYLLVGLDLRSIFGGLHYGTIFFDRIFGHRRDTGRAKANLVQRFRALRVGRRIGSAVIFQACENQCVCGSAQPC